MRLLDLFCGRWGWSRAFAARGWECVGVDLVEPPEIPNGCVFMKRDVLTIGNCLPDPIWLGCFDFIVASPPCDEFACFGMRHYRKNPPYPKRGIELFEHTRWLCEDGGTPYVLENVRAAQGFVGPAIRHAGSFFLWGTAVPPLLPKVHKAKWLANKHHGRKAPGNFATELNLPKPERKARLATIPPELANCVAEYAERLLEQRKTA